VAPVAFAVSVGEVLVTDVSTELMARLMVITLSQPAALPPAKVSMKVPEIVQV